MPFYVPRPVMPQINEEDYPDFIDFVLKHNVTVIHMTVLPHVLRPHQRIDKIKFELMPPEVLIKPIVASLDFYVLDGNHRWAAHNLQGTPVPCIQIGLPFGPAIDLMFQFPKTYALEVHAQEN